MKSRRVLLVALPPLVLWLSLFGRFLFAGAGVAPAERDGDFFLFAYPLADVAFEMLGQGIWPLWNPFIDCGVPLLVSVQQGVLYPPNWLHLLVSTERAFCLLIVAHTLFAGAGTWLYCRGRGCSPVGCSIATMVFAVGGTQVLHFYEGQGMVVFSMAWWPWILWQLDRLVTGVTTGRVAGLAVFLSLQFLAGFPLFTLVMAWLIPAYLLLLGVDWSRWCGKPNRQLILGSGVAALLALGLVAIVLLPAMDFVGQAHRGQLSLETAESHALPATHLVRSIVPGFFGHPVDSTFWGDDQHWNVLTFCGVVSLVLVPWSVTSSSRRVVLYWGVVAIGMLSYCLGGVVFDICYLFLPGFDLFRRPIALRLFLIFAVAVLAALGWDRLASLRERDGGRRGLAVMILLGLAGLVYGLSAWCGLLETPEWWRDLARRFPGGVALLSRESELAARFRDAASGLVLASTMVTLTGAVGWWIGRGRERGLVHHLVPALVAVELLMFGHPWLQTSRVADKREPSSRVRAAVGHSAGVYRLACLCDEESKLFNRFMLDRFETVGGAEDLLPRRYSYFLYALSGQPPFLQHVFAFGPDTPRPVKRQFLDLLNVRYYVCPRGAHDTYAIDLAGDPLLKAGVFTYRETSYDLFENPDAADRAVIVHRWQQVERLEELESRAVSDQDLLVRLEQRLEPLIRQGFAGGTTIEDDPGIEVSPTAESTSSVGEQVTIVSHEAHRVVARVRLDRPGLVVFSDTWTPDWRATVDGRPGRVLPANLFMRAVPCDAGEHTIELRYVSATFRAGAWLSLGSLILLSVLAAVSWRTPGRPVE